MEYRLLGRSGLKVSVFSFGAMTFGNGSGTFGTVGATHGSEAARQIDMCLDAGVNLFDTADVYSAGQSEEILGEITKDRRQHVLIATKCFGSTGPGVNDLGSSRKHIIEACEASLRRLKTDYIDLYQIHNQDLLVPPEETLRALDDLVRAGKVRYTARQRGRADARMPVSPTGVGSQWRQGFPMDPRTCRRRRVRNLTRW